MYQVINTAYLPADRFRQRRLHASCMTGLSLKGIVTHYPENAPGIFFKAVETIVVLND